MQYASHQLGKDPEFYQPEALNDNIMSNLSLNAADLPANPGIPADVGVNPCLFRPVFFSVSPKSTPRVTFISLEPFLRVQIDGIPRVLS